MHDGVEIVRHTVRAVTGRVALGEEIVRLRVDIIVVDDHLQKRSIEFNRCALRSRANCDRIARVDGQRPAHALSHE